MVGPVMSKPRPLSARPLSLVTNDIFAQAYARQGFAARELVTRWAEIVGQEIAAGCEPLKMQWPREMPGQPQLPATLVLRVEGPMVLELQHLNAVILERVNRFLGWNAVGKLAFRQAPLARPKPKARVPVLDPEAIEKVTQTLGDIEDEPLRVALARLGAAVKRR